MSYNIDNIDIVSMDGFCITRSALQDLAEKLSGEDVHPPEGNFIDGFLEGSGCENVRGMLFAERIDWTGEGSGHTFDEFKECLKSFNGTADMVLTWEGGDSHSGLRVRNGKVTEHEIVMALGKEKP
jgi:hypothetical protein